MDLLAIEDSKYVKSTPSAFKMLSISVNTPHSSSTLIYKPSNI